MVWIKLYYVHINYMPRNYSPVLPQCILICITLQWCFRLATMRKRTTEKRWGKLWRVCSGGEWLNMVRMAVNTQINNYMYNRAALLPFVTARLFPLTSLRVKIWTPRSPQGADVQQFLQFYTVHMHAMQAMCVYECSSFYHLVLAESMSSWPDVGLRLSHVPDVGRQSILYTSVTSRVTQVCAFEKV